MKRAKRKYTRHVKPEPIPDNVQSKSSPVKEESSVIVPPGDNPVGKVIYSEDTTVTRYIKFPVFSFNDLPLSIRIGVEKIIAYRKSKGLPDDSKERKALAIKMFVGNRPR